MEGNDANSEFESTGGKRVSRNFPTGVQRCHFIIQNSLFRIDPNDQVC